MAKDNLSFIGVGRFRGFWNATTNSGTLTSDGGYDSDRVSGVPLLPTGSGQGATSSAGGFHTASKGAGVALTASAGDYFQLTAAGTPTIDSESNWYVNDYVICKSGSAGEFKWVRLSYTDTISSIVMGDITNLSDVLLDTSGTTDGHILTVRTVDSTSSFSGSNNLKFHNATNTMQLTGTLSVSGAIEATEFKTTIVSSSVIYQSGSTKFGDSSGDVHDFTGSIYLGHNLNVSGSTTLNAATATTVSASSNLTTAGNAYVVGTLNVTGNANFDGTITCDDSITVDSVTLTDTEFGYLDGLTLGTIAASKVVTVDANKDFAGYRNISGSGIIQTVGSVSGSGDIAVSGAVHAASFYGDGSGLSGIDSVSGSSRHYSTTGIETSGYLNVSGNANLAGTISGSSTLQAVGNAIIGGTLSVTGNATFDEDIFVDDKIYKKGVTDTYIDFDDTTIRFAVDQDSLDSTVAWRNFALTSGSARLNYDKVGIATLINYSGSDAAHPALMVEADGNKAVGIGIRPSFSGRTGLTLDVSGSTAHGWQTSGTLDNHHFTGSVYISDNLNLSGTATLSHALPTSDNTYDLGSIAKRWRNIYTGDLHLKNDRGDWTLVEEEDYLTITNNKTGKRFKLLMEELDQ